MRAPPGLTVSGAGLGLGTGVYSLDREAFETAYWVLGAQRTTKVIGIFTRLDRRDGKPIYLRHLPRLWRLLGEELGHPALAAVRAWYDRHLPPELRRAPETGSTA